MLSSSDLNPQTMDEGRTLMKLAACILSSKSKSAEQVTPPEDVATPLAPPPTAETPATHPTHGSCPAAGILYRLILHLGSRPVQQLLSELSDGGVNCQWLSRSSVMSGLVRLCSLEGEMSAVGNRVLEKVDTYLWSARNNFLAPHVSAAICGYIVLLTVMLMFDLRYP